jgi:hypothetical protein
MLCYKDRTFCYSDCTNTKCFRYFSEQDRSRVDQMDLPIALSDFSKDCEGYRK